MKMNKETEFMKLSQHVNRIMMQKSPGAVSYNRNKKKTSHLFRESRSRQGTRSMSAH